MKELAALGRLETLNVGQAQVTDVGLKELAALTELRDLDLSYNKKVTDAGLKEVAALKGLQR